jgi:hypothetical protein
LTITCNIANAAAAFATSLPFTIYFLGFLNYFTMSSLYVLLNFPIPEQLFDYLSFMYE